MTEKEMWAAYCNKYPECENEAYEAWCYGSDTPDLLAKLTLEGIKTATARHISCTNTRGAIYPRRAATI